MSGVVVTGLGCLSALGPDVATSWAALLAGADGCGPIRTFDVSGSRCRQGAEVREDWLEAGGSRRAWSRATRLILPAAREALAQAGLLAAVPEGIALSVATTAGAMVWGEDFLRGLVQAKRGSLLRRIARQQPQQQLLDLQEALGFESRLSTIIGNACASGGNALGHGADLLLTGQAEVVLAGGYEAMSELLFFGFDCLQASSTTRCRPFDTARDGLLLGEAAAFLVLETTAHAARRGAPVLAHLAGYGHATDNHHLTQPAPTGVALVAALTAAVRRAGLKPEDIGYVNAHGTGTPLNDPAEIAAYSAFFGPEHMARLPVSSTKAATGHTLGAAGALEAVLTVQALRTGNLPPQLGLQSPLPGISLVPHAGLQAPDLRHAISANLGFGGSNAALVFSREEGSR